jgi:hypothetical protein
MSPVYILTLLFAYSLKTYLEQIQRDIAQICNMNNFPSDIFSFVIEKIWSDVV